MVTKADISLEFPDCVRLGSGPCDAWVHMAEQRRLSVRQYDELRAANDNLRRASVSLGQGAEDDLRRIESLEAKLENAEHNCDMLLRYIDQALRDARQLKASLDDWAVSETDADAHRLRSTRAYQIIKGLETASHSRSPDGGVPAPEQIGAPSMSAGRSTPAQPTPRCPEAWHDLGFTWRCVLPADHAGKHKMEQER
jgi:hypothetical protein